MTHQEIIDQLAKVLATLRDEQPDPITRVFWASMRVDALRAALIQELRELAGDTSPLPPPEAGSWRTRPSLLNPPLP